MPLHNNTPHHDVCAQCKMLLLLKKSKIAAGKVTQLQCMMLMLVLVKKTLDEGSCDQAKAFLAAAMMLSAASFVSTIALTLPRVTPQHQSTTAGPMQQVSNFSAPVFWEQFSFCPGHFWEVMQALRWTDTGCLPRVVKMGRDRHKYTFCLDFCLMVVLHQLAFAVLWCDIKKVLGG